jgi:hypothetical protein
VELAIYHLVSAYPSTSKLDRTRTLDIILSVCLARLVVVYHGHYLQQVLLAQLLQTVGKLLHIDVLVAAVLLPAGVLATHTVGISRARLLQQRQELWLGVSERLAIRISTRPGSTLQTQLTT